jgi:hypothetical protein
MNDQERSIVGDQSNLFLKTPEVPPTPPNKKPMWALFILILLAVAGGVIFAWRSSPEPELILNSNATTSIPAHSPEKDSYINSSSPKDIYLEMRRELDSVQDYAQFEALVQKYGSSKWISKIESGRAQIDALPTQFKDQLVTIAKNPPSSEITYIQEVINGGSATLKVSSNKSGFRGTVVMILENEQWKIEKESWAQE